MRDPIVAVVSLLLIAPRAHAQPESFNGPPGAVPMRSGVRACPPGHAISGIRADRNQLLCLRVQPDAEHPLTVEFISTGALGFPRNPQDAAAAGSYAGPVMHFCGDDSFLTGLNIASNRFLCRSFGSNQLLPTRRIATLMVDQPPNHTQRRDMHACPVGHVLMGYHHDQNIFLCGALFTPQPPPPPAGPGLPPPAQVRTTILSGDTVIDRTGDSCSRATVRVRGRPTINVSRGQTAATLIGPARGDGSVRVEWVCAGVEGQAFETMTCDAPPSGSSPASRLIITRPSSGRSFDWVCVTP